MKKLFCFFGMHDWIYTPAVYRDSACERLAIATKEATRKCTCCGKVQQRELHCLGLNPPEYVTTWYTIHDSYNIILDKK